MFQIKSENLLVDFFDLCEVKGGQLYNGGEKKSKRPDTAQQS